MKLKQRLDYLIYRAKYRYGKNLPLRAPVDVSLELAGICNMSCSYCYYSKENADHIAWKTGLMKLDTAIKIIDESAAIGVHSLKFNYRGESTINPHYKTVTAYAKRLARDGVFIDRLTNSNFKFRSDRDDIFEGLCNQTKVKVSYDSFIKEVFETQRAGGDHALTTRNIDIFYNHPLRKNAELVIQAVRTQLNKDEDIAGQAAKRWPSATVSIRDVVSGRKEGDIDHLQLRSRDLENRQSCIQAHVRLIFAHDGQCHPCCPSIDGKLIIGNSDNQTVEEIFNGFRARRLRRMLKDKSAFKSIETCVGCPSFESYSKFKPVWNS